MGTGKNRKKEYLARLDNETISAIGKYNKSQKPRVIVLWIFLVIFLIGGIGEGVTYIIIQSTSFTGGTLEYFFVGCIFTGLIPFLCIFIYDYCKKRHIKNPKTVQGTVRSSIQKIGYQTFVEPDGVPWRLVAYSGKKYEIGTRVEIKVSANSKLNKCKIIKKL